MKRAGTTSIFASRDFRLFYFGQATSYIGDGLRTIAIPLLVFKLTGSALNLGITFALEYFPFGVFSLIGGSLADRLDRKRLMIACDALRCLIIASFAATYATGTLNLWILYPGIVLHAICGAIFNGGQASSIPYVLGTDRATQAVAALQGAETAAGTIAPPAGGALFGLVGPLPALVINAATYLASLVSLRAVRDLGPDSASGMPRFAEIANDIRIGFRFLQGDRAMRLMTTWSLIGNFFGTIGYVAIVPFLKRDLHGSDASVGALFGAVGLGTVIGSLIAPHLRPPFGKLIVVSVVGGSLSMLPIVWTHSLLVVIVAWSLAGIASGISMANIIGWRMRIIPEETVGRVFGAVRLVVLAGTLPGSIIGGALADAHGARLTQAVAIGGGIAMAAWLLSRRTIRAEVR